MQSQPLRKKRKKPQRDLPIGIIGSLLICTVLYMIVSFVLTGMVPYTQLDVSDPVAFALHFVGEDTIAGLLAVGAMTGMTTVLLVVMYGQVRVSYAMSRDGLLPKALARVNKRVKIPLLNTWITGVVAALLAGLFRSARISEFSKYRYINSLHIRLLCSTYFTKNTP
ncbi:amino acid permease [Bacillus pacificus]